MIVRGYTDKDQKTVADLIARAFGQRDEADLVDALRSGGHMALELVAEDRGRVIGHVALSRMPAPEKWLALAPVCVDPKRQRKGVGSALCQTAMAYANAPVVVLGDPNYYARFGFDFSLGERLNTPYPAEYTGVSLPEGHEMTAQVDLTYSKPFGG
jgi:putative acetyltransferase